MFDSWQATMESYLEVFGDNITVQVIVLITGAFIIAMLVDRVVAVWVKRFAANTDSIIDDQFIEILHKPLFFSILLLGFASVVTLLKPEGSIQTIISSVLYSLAILIWAQFLLRTSKLFISHFAFDPDKLDVLNPKTLPLFENLAFVLIIVIAIYYIFLNWQVDMTAWLASAGIVGIAVGFAAKDTLANLFSGVFIMADAPYKIGDFVVLDGGERGEITKIGIRSTRLLTRDDVEVTVPNAVMGNTKIINESGGRHEKFRIRVKVGVAYGSDIDRVRDILMTVGLEEKSTCQDPEPRVRFREFATSSLNFELLCWIDQPVLRGRILDQLNSAVYKAFIREGIEIPYTKQDIYIKSMPEK